MRRTLLIAGVILVLAAGGVLAYSQLRTRPTPEAGPRGDPALAVAVAVGALMRSETYTLSSAQIDRILPLLRVLRDTDPNDAEASRALAEEITRVFTPEQRAELDRLREEARARRQERLAQGGVPGEGNRGFRSGGPPPGGPGFGPGGPGGPGFGPGGAGQATGSSRAEVRRRLLGRLIERLEARN